MKSARELVDRLRAYQPPNTDLGQHFLIDDAMLERMVAIAGVNKDDHILEIGPGPGTLTQYLLKTGANVIAIEIDDAPVLHLDEAFREEQNTKQLILHHDDALNAAWPSDITKVVANIPYQISSPLIEKITRHNKEHEGVLQQVVLMVQHEFGQRLSMNHPADVGSLGMTVALDWDVTEHHMVPPHHFSPQPAVQSQVIELCPHNKVFSVDKRLVRQTIHLAFEQRRKKIRSTLRRAPKRISRIKGWHAQRWKDAMQSLQELEMMDARPEELTLDDWVQLAEKVEKGSM
ncbi:MAG: 16S rRNA (adenine(1518)-N(6)/adenine(1519)-N(6))-dimethyltransferase RsmA [Candidatus Thermoplasmatota archaeon]|nr:16S rRNA (adenine(1518)-N(6)/adenine(1519)-N(6))-dimethyltransferase RsmA [Candidatus Thermoplasmatota archaeon]MEC8142029.1 16S rRNA (adenine(1518)-N(6)/adenine(1519)-N(6))-dimethyltransferase RsmA [Candidatus Thermoplasmatota archaeon]